MGKNYVESSLKRFLKRKVKITLGLIVAFMIIGGVSFSAEYVKPIEAAGEGSVNERLEKELNIKIKEWHGGDKKNSSINYGVAAVTNGKVNIN